MLVEISSCENRRHTLLLGPADGKLFSAFCARGQEAHARPFGLRPIEGVEDPGGVFLGVSVRCASEGHDKGPRMALGVFGGLRGLQGVLSLNLGCCGPCGAHRALPRAPDLSRRGSVVRGAGVPDDFEGEHRDIGCTGALGGVLDFGVEDL